MIFTFEGSQTLTLTVFRLPAKRCRNVLSAAKILSRYRAKPLGEDGRMLFLPELSLDCAAIRDRVFNTLSLIEWSESSDTVFPNYNMTSSDVAVEVLKRGWRIDGETVTSIVEFAAGLI